jgi:uncharacterized RDD family membrane protein YckC
VETPRDSSSSSNRQLNSWPGERLGLPEEGQGSIARFGRRLVAILIDWGVATVISFGLFRNNPWATLAVFGVMQLVLVATAAGSIGHRALRLKVMRLDGAWPGLVPALIRAVLLCLAVPALIWNSDQRGLHDVAAGTILVRR